jgi:hypothetical protein
VWWRQWGVHVSADSADFRFAGTRHATAPGGAESADDTNDTNDTNDADATAHLHGGNFRGASGDCRC